MKKLKYEILFIILFMSVGIAVVSSNLLINGSTPIASNPDDFSVYFSDVSNSSSASQSSYELTSPTTLVVSGTFFELTDELWINFSLKNSSRNYNAQVSLSCSGNSDYIYVQVDPEVEIISAQSSISGFLYVSLNKQYTGDNDLEQDITCTVNASAVERTTLGVGSDEIIYNIGDVISFGDEKFNIISQTDDTVTMLAQYNIGSDNRQTEEENPIMFSDEFFWEYTPGPKEVHLSYSDYVNNLIFNYTHYLEVHYLDYGTVAGDLLSLNDLKVLGCTIQDDYSSVGSEDCYNSPYKSWLINDQHTWTNSANPESESYLWFMDNTGDLDYDSAEAYIGVRPIITINKTTLRDYLYD